MDTKILDDAVRELKENDFKDLFDKEAPSVTYPETKVEFDASAYLDSEYVQDNVERLNLYRKLSDAATTEQVKEWKEELEDRFGPLPKSGLNLLKAALRSEEHTSELQSRGHLVCRLLLEKKNQEQLDMHEQLT